MECVPCGKTFTGRVCYDQHMKSEKHKKKVISFSFLNGHTGTTPILDDEIIALDSKNNINRCDVCDISFNSPASFQTHSLTRAHAEKILENIGNINGGVNCNAVSSSDLSSNGKIDDLKIDKSAENAILPELEENKKPHPLTYASCTTCNKTFSGLEPYKQHLQSALHIKKIQSQEGPYANTTTFSCEPCKKFFSGQVPYAQHMTSEVHKKKLQHLDFLKTCTSGVDSPSKMEVEGDHLKTDNTNPWFCNICNVQCSGVFPYQQHLSGAAHLKNKNKLQLTSQNKEMDYILPDLEKRLNIVSTDKLKECIKIFLPDENLDFDKLANNTHADSGCENGAATASEEIAVKQDEIESNPEVSQVCHICNVELLNAVEIASHYESVEHFNKRWHNTTE